MKHCIHNDQKLASSNESQRKFIQLTFLDTGISLIAAILRASAFRPSTNITSKLHGLSSYGWVERYMLCSVEGYIIIMTILYLLVPHSELSQVNISRRAEHILDHLDLSVKLHYIHIVMVIVAHIENSWGKITPRIQERNAVHITVLTQLKNMIIKKYPDT